MITRLPKYPSQGQQIVLGWDNIANLRDWTAYQGTDGLSFLPPDDRNGYSDGVERQLLTGAVFMAGWRVSRQTFPWVSDGQIAYLFTNFDNENVTVAIHAPYSIGKTGTYLYNAVCVIDMNQMQTLERKSNGYKLFQVKLNLVEAL